MLSDLFLGDMFADLLNDLINPTIDTTVPIDLGEIPCVPVEMMPGEPAIIAEIVDEPITVHTPVLDELLAVHTHDVLDSVTGEPIPVYEVVEAS